VDYYAVRLLRMASLSNLVYSRLLSTTTKFYSLNGFVIMLCVIFRPTCGCKTKMDTKVNDHNKLIIVIFCQNKVNSELVN